MESKSGPIGYINFLSRPKGCPYEGLWISDIFIRTRYRGAGFGTILMEKASVLLKNSRMQEFFVGVFTENKAASGFFEKYGFKEGEEKFEPAGTYRSLYKRIPPNFS